MEALKERAVGSSAGGRDWFAASSSLRGGGPLPFPGRAVGAAAAPGAGTRCSVPAWETLGSFRCELALPSVGLAVSKRVSPAPPHRLGVSCVRLDEASPGVVEAKLNNLL